MKKIVLLALLAMIMVGCDKISNEIKEAEKAQQIANTAIQEWHNQIVIIDSCEYISEETRGFVEHKGNCRFCAERNKRMVREQVDSILTEIFD